MVYTFHLHPRLLVCVKYLLTRWNVMGRMIRLADKNWTGLAKIQGWIVTGYGGAHSTPST